MSPAKPPDDELDEAWLLARARGEPFEHPDPERGASYVRLERALAALPLVKSPEGWRAQVLEAIGREEGGGARATDAAPAGEAKAVPASQSRRAASPGAREAPGREGLAGLQGAFWHWLARGSPWVLAVAALALLKWGHWGAKGVEAGELEVAVVPGLLTRGNLPEKGGGVARGSSLVIKGVPIEGGELRVYRDEHELVLRCPGGAGCRETREGGRGVLRAELTLGARGKYRVMLLSGANVPPPAGSEDADLAAAAAAQTKIQFNTPLEVF